MNILLWLYTVISLTICDIHTLIGSMCCERPVICIRNRIYLLDKNMEELACVVSSQCGKGFFFFFFNIGKCGKGVNI